MIFYHLNATDLFLERWLFYMHTVTFQIYLIKHKQFISIFIKEQKSGCLSAYASYSMSGLTNISTTTIAFPAEDFVPPSK